MVSHVVQLGQRSTSQMPEAVPPFNKDPWSSFTGSSIGNAVLPVMSPQLSHSEPSIKKAPLSVGATPLIVTTGRGTADDSKAASNNVS